MPNETRFWSPLVSFYPDSCYWPICSFEHLLYWNTSWLLPLNILKQQLEIPQVTSPPSAGRCTDTAVFSHPDTDTDTTQHSHCEKQIQNCMSVLTKGGRGRKRKDTFWTQGCLHLALWGTVGSTLSSELSVVTEKGETTNQTNWRWRRYHFFPFILYRWFLNFPGEDSGAIPFTPGEWVSRLLSTVRSLYSHGGWRPCASNPPGIISDHN